MWQERQAERERGGEEGEREGGGQWGDLGKRGRRGDRKTQREWECGKGMREGVEVRKRNILRLVKYM